VYAALPAEVRIDPTEQRKPVTAKLDADLYPVWIEAPDDNGKPARRLVVQMAGHLTAPDVFDEMFFLTATLDGTRPATLHVPAHDRAGRSRGWLLVEIRRNQPAEAAEAPTAPSRPQ
jgi:hypothetical protein